MATIFHVWNEIATLPISSHGARPHETPRHYRSGVEAGARAMVSEAGGERWRSR